jgi:multimeric flavodoxin WrbA
MLTEPGSPGCPSLRCVMSIRTGSDNRYTIKPCFGCPTFDITQYDQRPSTVYPYILDQDGIVIGTFINRRDMQHQFAKHAQDEERFPH